MPYRKDLGKIPEMQTLYLGTFLPCYPGVQKPTNSSKEHTDGQTCFQTSTPSSHVLPVPILGSQHPSSGQAGTPSHISATMVPPSHRFFHWPPHLPRQHSNHSDHQPFLQITETHPTTQSSHSIWNSRSPIQPCFWIFWHPWEHCEWSGSSVGSFNLAIGLWVVTGHQADGHSYFLHKVVPDSGCIHPDSIQSLERLYGENRSVHQPNVQLPPTSQ